MVAAADCHGNATLGNVEIENPEGNNVCTLWIDAAGAPLAGRVYGNHLEDDHFNDLAVDSHGHALIAGTVLGDDPDDPAKTKRSGYLATVAP